MIPTAKHAAVGNELPCVKLSDQRIISVPLDWFPRLKAGTETERNTFRLIADGSGIHWPILDEDISVNGLLKGIPSGESPGSIAKWRADRVNPRD